MIYYNGNVYLDSMGDYANEGETLTKMYHLRNNYKIWATCRQHDLLTWKRHVDYVMGAGDNGIKLYTVKLVDTKSFIGVAGLVNFDMLNQSSEFSLYLDPKEQGKGYAQDALKTLCNHGFRNLNLNRIYGEVFSTNEVALKSFHKCGFVQEGILRQSYYRDGKFIDTHMIGLTKDMWQKNLWSQLPQK